MSEGEGAEEVLSGFGLYRALHGFLVAANASSLAESGRAASMGRRDLPRRGGSYQQFLGSGEARFGSVEARESHREPWPVARDSQLPL